MLQCQVMKENHMRCVLVSLNWFDWVVFNVRLNTLYVISGTGLRVKWPQPQCRSTEGSNARKDQASIPSGPPHNVTILHIHATYSQTQNNTYIHKHDTKQSEMGPVRQNPIQRTVSSVHMWQQFTIGLMNAEQHWPATHHTEYMCCLQGFNLLTCNISCIVLCL